MGKNDNGVRRVGKKLKKVKSNVYTNPIATLASFYYDLTRNVAGMISTISEYTEMVRTCPTALEYRQGIIIQR